MDDVSLRQTYSSSPEESSSYLPSDSVSSSTQTIANDSITILSNNGSPAVSNTGVEPYIEQLDAYQWGKPFVSEPSINSYDVQQPMEFSISASMQPAAPNGPEIDFQQQYSPVGQPVAINVSQMQSLQHYQQLQQMQHFQQSGQLHQYLQSLQHPTHTHQPILIPYVAQFAPMVSMKQGFMPDYEHSLDFSEKSKHPFSCPHCPSSFRLRGYLTRHMKKHAIKKAYSCPFYDCNDKSPCHPSGGFSRRDTYKTHLKARHFLYPAGTRSEHRSKMPGICSGCGEKFDSNEKWVEEHIHNGKCSGLADIEKKRQLNEQQANCESQLADSQYQEYQLA